jgi:hypothetical protein
VPCFRIFFDIQNQVEHFFNIYLTEICVGEELLRPDALDNGAAQLWRVSLRFAGPVSPYRIVLMLGFALSVAKPSLAVWLLLESSSRIALASTPSLLRP